MPRLRVRALTLVLLWPAALRAQATASIPELHIEVTGCPDGSSSSLPALVKLEIDVLLREPGPTHAPPDHITIQCVEDSARITVTMQGQLRDSRIDLGALTPDHRPRAIALAAAELVHSMSNRPVEVPPPKPAVAAPPLDESPALEPARRTAWQRPTLAVGGVATWLGQPATVLFGARAAFRAPLSALLAPAVSIEAATGGFHADSAEVSVTTVSAAATLYFGVSTGTVRWDAGPGARIGWVRMRGEPDAGAAFEGHDLSGAWGGLEACVRAAYGISQSRSPSFALELGAGIVTLPVHGRVDGTERVYSVAGPWLSIGAEVGIAW